MHALRFLPGHATEPQLAGLCGSSVRNMGFHPAMFRAPRRGCSYCSAWDGCWAAECRDIVAAEWGCASRGGGASSTCETPFATTVLQVRHPLRVVESLVVKFCRALDEPPHQYATSFFAALWPEAVKWDDLGCARTFGWFWTLYNEAMLAAHESGYIASWFRIEDLHDPCELARTAGFLDASSVVSRDYAHAAATAACTPDGRSRQPPTSTASRRNTRNKGQVSLTVADLAGPDDGDLCCGAVDGGVGCAWVSRVVAAFEFDKLNTSLLKMNRPYKYNTSLRARRQTSHTCSPRRGRRRRARATR